MDISKIDETVKNGEKYYRAVEKYMGKTIEFEPQGFYEAIDDEGNPIFKYDTFWVSETPEVAASKSIGGAVMGLYSMFMQHGKNPGVFYIYEITEEPDVDISHWDIGDFTHLKEVRYRRPVQGKYRGKVTITDDMKKRLNAFYEVTGLEAYDEPDEETAEIFDNTDYEKYIGGVEIMLNEIGEGNLQPYEISIVKSTDTYKEYKFVTEDNDEYHFEFNKPNLDDNMWRADFGVVDGSEVGNFSYTKIVDKGRLYRVMSTIIKLMRGFFANTNPDILVIEPIKTKNKYDDRRFSLYLQFIKKHLPLGYEYTENSKEILIKKKVVNLNEAEIRKNIIDARKLM